MAYMEIERKFLVKDFEEIWRPNEAPDSEAGSIICQGYLVEHANRSLRVRLTREGATLTLKGPREGALRIEYEDPISVTLGEQLLLMAEPNVVSKMRYPVVAENRLWSIDKFLDLNSGLIIAETELNSPTEQVDIPPWCGTEITDDGRFYNEHLARNPYSNWE